MTKFGKEERVGNIGRGSSKNRGVRNSLPTMESMFKIISVFEVRITEICVWFSKVIL